ncbi:MAG: hypothetical protein IKR48_10385 [Kiritimatiellae bacterium]|nr:hypothetical protein [Kiritimatiellia bacterium]
MTCKLSTGIIVLLAATVSLHAETAVVVPDYASATNKDIVVATPVGYQKELKLITGETVRTYPTELSQHDASNCTAVLFCILSPDTYRGKYFLGYDGGCRCYMCKPYAPWPEQFQIGKHYSFCMLLAYDSEQDRNKGTFDLGYPPGGLCLNRGDGHLVYRNTQEIDKRLAELDKKYCFETNQLEKFRAELSTLPDSPKESRKRRQLRGSIHRIEEWVKVHEPQFRSELLAERERLSHFPGGAITNRVEPLRHLWNSKVRDLDAIRLPKLSYQGKTLDEILSDLDKRYVAEQKKKNPDYDYDAPLKSLCTITIAGNYPKNSIGWKRLHNLTISAGTLLDALQVLGKLPHVDSQVKTTKFGNELEFIYTVTDEGTQFDWSKSIYNQPLPDIELKNVTLNVVAKDLYDSIIVSSKSVCFKIQDDTKRKIVRSFSFQGKTYRQAIQEIEAAYGVFYDYRTSSWLDEKPADLDAKQNR